MIGGAEIRPLRNHGVGADLDLAQAVEDDVVPDPGPIPDGDLPRIGDADGRPHQNATPHLGPEESEEKPPPAVQELRRPGEQAGLDHPPQLNDPRRTSPEPGRQVKAGKVLNPFVHGHGIQG